MLPHPAIQRMAFYLNPESFVRFGFVCRDAYQALLRAADQMTKAQAQENDQSNPGPVQRFLQSQASIWCIHMGLDRVLLCTARIICMVSLDLTMNREETNTDKNKRSEKSTNVWFRSDVKSDAERHQDPRKHVKRRRRWYQVSILSSTIPTNHQHIVCRGSTDRRCL